MTPDPRGIDPAIGALLGEGSHQLAPPAGSVQRHPHMLQQPVWIWSVPVYFYVGGATGVAAAIGMAARFFGGRRLDDLVMPCRWIAATGGAISGLLLVHDLGRPERFLHMLRVFRPTSPMSMGSWILTFCAGPAGAAVLFRKNALGDAASLVSGVFGLPLASYTGVLLANTAVPVWQESRWALPALFAASGATAAGALLDLIDLNRPSVRAIETFGRVASTMEMAALQAVEWETSQVPQVGRALRNGLAGTLWNAAKVFALGALAISIFGGRSQKARIARSICGSAAALSAKWAVFQAGKASARDDEASFALQNRSLAPGSRPKT